MTNQASLPSTNSIALTAEQLAAVDALSSFISDPAPADWFFTFSGFAGTGKTFCMRELVARGKRSQVKFAFTAPTNKAAKVLRGITGHAQTIHSLLGLRVDKSGELKELIAGKKPDLSGVDVIFVDEGSMVNGQLFSILRYEAEKANVKVVFIGDAAQLPPVGEPHSQIWDGKLGAGLSTVMRHDNQILTLATQVRSVMGSIAPSISFKSDFDEAGGVWKLTRESFKKEIYNAAHKGLFADGRKAKVVAWRNVRVGEYNDIIRHAIFGSDAVPGHYLPGDRIVAAAPCERGDDILMSTDDEALVEKVNVIKHPLESKYMAIELTCRTEYNKVIRLLVIHPDSKATFDADCEKLAQEARLNGRLWKKFWDRKEIFHDIKYAYALTVHRSQGSTYENVWVDYQDILYNRNRKEAFQCLYTAVTRPTTKLYLA